MSTVDGTVEQTSRWVWTDYRTEKARSAQLISCPDRALHSSSQPHQLALLDRVQGLAAVSTLRSAASSTEGTLEGRARARAGYLRTTSRRAPEEAPKYPALGDAFCLHVSEGGMCLILAP